MDYSAARNLSLGQNSVLKSNEWCHLAWVTGKGGMRLYVNGVLAPPQSATVSFSALDNRATTHYLSQGGSTSSHGMQLDEWRVWTTQRSLEQIRENMYRRLTGREPGLAALWNFDDPAQPGRDATGHGFDGSLERGREIVADKLPNAVHGVVTDKDGRAVVNAQITFERDGQRVGPGTVTDNLGRYVFAGPTLDRPVTLFARKDELSCEGIELQPDGPTELNLQLRDLARLSGRTLALDDSPIPAVVVQAVPIDDSPGTNHIVGSGLVGDGLLGEYFDLRSLQALPNVPPTQPAALRRVDATVNFPYGPEGFAGPPLDQLFYARWTGLIRLREDANCEFFLNSDDGSRLFIDGALVVDHDGMHVFGEKSGRIKLAAGDHPHRLESINGNCLDGMVLSWSLKCRRREIVAP